MAAVMEDDSRGLWTPANFVRIVLRGIGQVLFQDNAATGLLFLIGIAIESPWMAVGALMGAIIGPVTAALTRFDPSEIRAGIFGFNPVLVGIASLFYLQPWPLTWALVVVGSIAATFVTNLMRRHLNFPTYTAPFVLVTWALILVAHAVAGAAIDVTHAPMSNAPVGFLNIVLRGTAEIMFGAKMITGLFFIVGIAINNRMHALLALLGSMMGTILSVYHHNAYADIYLGIYGYNASLVSIAVYLWRKSLLISLLAAAITLPLTEFFPSKQLGIPALTAPFILAAWVVILIGQIELVFVKEQNAT